jgi:hypothetical protein
LIKKECLLVIGKLESGLKAGKLESGLKVGKRIDERGIREENCIC